MTKVEKRAVAKARHHECMREMDERIRAARVGADLAELGRLRSYLIRERTAGYARPLIDAIDDYVEQISADRSALACDVFEHRMTWSRAFDKSRCDRAKLTGQAHVAHDVARLPCCQCSGHRSSGDPRHMPQGRQG
ncbi:hypothetical protein FXB40_26545 [Bradyrhizobium rifense]|uniref:Uncharacterized protein n=1 Tax=Bradyrhizobium rifense TaxID=515499 RepID=A0A5D3KCU3_9BRAD|nr:hypothetical protein [Bradyrhizobium rifense]TYL92009.1 hypothetical protein FXB40_26545 [Bradyrhizobium rifense]